MGKDFLHRSVIPWSPLGMEEQSFLLACLQEGAKLPALSSAFDWSTFGQRAISDGLAPILYHRLKQEPANTIPSESLNQLKRNYYQTLSINHIRLTELRRLGQLLQTQNIRLLVLKGGALAQTVYADPALRFMGDLDVAVPPDQGQKALERLRADGYIVHDEEEGIDDSADDQTLLHQQGWHIRLAKTVLGKKIELEFHWPARQTVLVQQVAHLDVSQLWETAVPLDKTANLWQPAAPMMLLHLCLHTGLQHRFNDLGLRHYLDIHRLITHYQPGADFWLSFVTLAQKTGVTQLSYFCLWLTQQLLTTEIPELVLQRLSPSPWKQRLFQRVFTPADAINRTRALYDSRLWLWRLFTTDSPADFVTGPWQMLFPGRDFLAEYYGTESGLRLWLYGMWYPIRAVGRAGTRRWREFRQLLKRQLS